jgi:hypothetical protein
MLCYRFANMQIELARQTSIPPPEQILVFNDRLISDVIGPNDIIMGRLRTSEDRPIALLHHTDSNRRTTRLKKILRMCHFVKQNLLLINFNHFL